MTQRAESKNSMFGSRATLGSMILRIECQSGERLATYKGATVLVIDCNKKYIILKRPDLILLTKASYM